MDLDLNIDCDGQLTDFKSSLFADYLSTDTTLSENTDLKQLDLQAEQLKRRWSCRNSIICRPCR